MEVIEKFLKDNRIDLSGIDAIVGRGGSCCSVQSGIYAINDQLIKDTREAKGGLYHSSMLGVQLAGEFQKRYGGIMLTGESRSLIKKPGDLLYAGTAVTSGEAEADVIHVGADNFSETILKDAKRYKPAKSMLQHDLNRLLGIVSILIVPTGIGMFLVQYLRVHLTWQQAVLKTVAGMVGMIPEGLVVLTSVALAISIIRLSKTQVLVQDLYSIESLARVDVLCLDKTGTLTQGKMQVQEVVPLNGASLHHIEEVMIASWFFHPRVEFAGVKNKEEER